MDNRWKPSKCGSTWQSSAEPAMVVAPPPTSTSASQVKPHDSSRTSMVSPTHYAYPQIVEEPCSSNRKMMADPLLQTTNFNLYNSAPRSVLGSSFFTLLSGPPSFPQYDSQQILSSKPPNSSSNVHAYSSSSIISPTKNIDSRHLKPRIDTIPVPNRALASDSGNTASCLHNIVQTRKVNDPSLEPDKEVSYQQLNGFASLKSVTSSSPTGAQSGKLQSLCNPHQLSPSTSGFPRVFCLYASGDLFLSNSGLLGVVCSCHGLLMSISKFSEHSGLRDVNPGDAVHTDSGETIAQWRKVYLSKFGIRIPEDQIGWHWPEGLTLSPDSLKRVSNVLTCSGPSRALVASKQPLNNIVFPDNHHSSYSNPRLPNGIVHTGASKNITENEFQSCQTYIDPISKTKISFTCQKNLPNVRSVGKSSDTFKFNRLTDADIVGKAKVSSNIELRLGQPSPQSQTFGKSNIPGFGTPCSSRVDHPREFISSVSPIHNVGSNRITVEKQQFVNCAAQAAKSSSIGRQSLSNFSNLGFGAYSSRNPFQPEQLKSDMVAASVHSMLFSHSGNPKDKMQTKGSHGEADDSDVMPNKQQYFESRISKLDPMNFGCNTDNSNEVKFNGFSRSVTVQAVAPRPPLISGASLMGMSSPNTDSTMSNEATRMINLHTPSLRQAVKYSNEGRVSSPRGLNKDQFVNSLNELKPTERRDGHKLTRKHNFPELAMKSDYSGITSWTAGGVDKSAGIEVSREASFQTRDVGVPSGCLCDPHQTGPPLPRVVMNGNICPSEHRKCCQSTSCVYIPDKCSCCVQKKSLNENSNLEGKNSLATFGEPSQIGASILTASNMDKGCILLGSKYNSSGKFGESMKPNLKKVVFNTFQWKDVPSKISGRCRASSKDQTEKFLDDRTEVKDQTSVQKADCVKEQVMSNISQTSVKISNGDSCTDDAQNTGCAKNFAVDEGSGIQKGWSSDDVVDSGSNTRFDGFACKTNLKNEVLSKAIPDRSNRSLIDELRVIDSLRMKKVQNQVHTGLSKHENASSMQTFEKDFEGLKRKRETKLKILGKSFPTSPVSSVSTGSSGQSSQFLERSKDRVCSIGHNFKRRRSTLLPSSTACCKDNLDRRVYDDCFEIPESSRGKVRLDSDFSKTKQVWKQEFPCKRITKPIVCGRYGLISNGDTSKPAKIFSLAKILKTAKRCGPTGNDVLKKSPAKASKKSINREGNRRSARISNFKEDKYLVDQGTGVFFDVDPMETSEGTETEDSKDADVSYMLEKRKEHKIERNRRKSKEVRKRSLYELITKEKDSGFSTILKNIESVPQDTLKNVRDGNNRLAVDNTYRSPEELKSRSSSDVDRFCHVCRSLTNDEMNCLLECNRCLIKVHQACYGISKVPRSHWYCRPCRENATSIVCVLCGYEGGVMTRAVQSSNIVRSLLNAWNVALESPENPPIKPSQVLEDQLNGCTPSGNQVDSYAPPNTIHEHTKASSVANTMMLNSVTAGILDTTVKQWVHMVCGLWTPGTRCPNVDTMSSFDVSGACYPKGNVVCSICKRAGGCCIRCRVMDCAIHFHPWCGHQKGLLQSEVEGVDDDKVGFYGRCELHATEDHFNHKTNSRSIEVMNASEKETCARTEGYKGRKREGYRHDSQQLSSGTGRCLVRQEQVDAWNHINKQMTFKRRIQKPPVQPVQDIEYDFRKEYARYKQSKGWKHLVVYKSGIHALGLYTSLFISQGTVVVEYVGEIVGLRVADRREREYQSGKQLQYKSACYFFRIDKEHIIDATRKGGIARFVNHSCQPNCVAKVITLRGEKKVVFFAERDIYPGEEVTYDYHFNNEDEAKKILCSCNSNNCRRYLN